jgi:ketosteroid isomerase-like protein
MSHSDTARAFIDAFNRGDLDTFAATLHPQVELHAGRGLRRGVVAARAWATRTPGGVQQLILVDELRERGDRALALIRREWWWDDQEESSAGPARVEEMAWLFELRDGLISSWRPFDDREEALAAFDADP